MMKMLKASVAALTLAGSMLAAAAPVAAQAQDRGGGDRSFQGGVRDRDSNNAGAERRSGDHENWGDRDDRGRGGWGGGWRPGYGYGYGYRPGAVIAGAALGAAIGGAYYGAGYYGYPYYSGYPYYAGFPHYGYVRSRCAWRPHWRRPYRCW